MKAIHEGLKELGFKELIRPEIQIGLVASAVYPDDPNWSFQKVHDYCYERGFTIYPGKVCALGAIDVEDIEEFFKVLREALIENNIQVPVQYR